LQRPEFLTATLVASLWLVECGSTLGVRGALRMPFVLGRVRSSWRTSVVYVGEDGKLEAVLVLVVT